MAWESIIAKSNGRSSHSDRYQRPTITGRPARQESRGGWKRRTVSISGADPASRWFATYGFERTHHFAPLWSFLSRNPAHRGLRNPTRVRYGRETPVTQVRRNRTPPRHQSSV